VEENGVYNEDANENDIHEDEDEEGGVECCGIITCVTTTRELIPSTL